MYRRSTNAPESEPVVGNSNCSSPMVKCDSESPRSNASPEFTLEKMEVMDQFTKEFKEI